jgi:hypothetical protein
LLVTVFIALYSLFKKNYLTAFFLLTIGYSVVLKAFAKYQLEYDIGFQGFTNIISIDTLILPMIFFVFFLLGVIHGAYRLKANRFNASSMRRKVWQGGSLRILVVILSLFAILILSNGFNWLSVNRDSAASIGTPIFRYIYPFIFAFTLLYLTKVISNTVIFTKQKFVLLILFSFIVFSLLSLRGWFIVTTFVILHGYVVQNNIKFMRVLFISVLLIISGIFLKDVAQYLLTGEYHFQFDFLVRIAQKAQGDYIDIFYVVEQYVVENGYNYGTSFLGYLFHFLPVDLRLEYVASSTDEINMFIDERTYIEKRFGYNVSSLQDAYLNYGNLGVVVAYFLGYAMIRIENKLWTVFYQTGYFSLSLFFAVFFLQNYGSLKWIIVGLFLDALRLMVKSYKKRTL